jgi:hypothetical protein
MRGLRAHHHRVVRETGAAARHVVAPLARPLRPCADDAERARLRDLRRQARAHRECASCGRTFTPDLEGASPEGARSGASACGT